MNNALVHVLEDRPVFGRIFKARFVLEGLGISLEIDDVAAIFLSLQDFLDGGTLPLICIIALAVPAADTNAPCLPVRLAVQHFSLLQDA